MSRLLLLSPSFFGYERSVAQAFRERGWEVDLRDERPSNRAWVRAMVRVAPGLLRRRIEAHYRSLAQELEHTTYDALLVIKGEVVPPWFIRDFQAQNPDAVCAYYTFDSIGNSPQGMRIVEFFPHRFTFDRADAESIPGFRYKPLFYAHDYTAGPAERSLAVSFVGTLHGERYRFAHAVTANLPSAECELFFYCQAPWYFWLQKLTSREIRAVSPDDVSYKPLDRAAVVALSQDSRAVLDLQRYGQKGLTMRTFEALATGAALITANEAITAEPFYDPARIHIVPRDPALIDSTAVEAFVASLDTFDPPQGFDRYSLAAWVAEFDAVFSGAPAAGEPS